MLDVEYLQRIRLVSRPFLHTVLANLLLWPNYNLFAKVKITVENMERIPRDETVIFAMNHTDRFNYWPFQYRMLRAKVFPFTTVWVKGKYYKNSLLAKGLDINHLIPVPSMGYLIEEYYQRHFHKKMDKGLYRTVRDIIEGKTVDNGPGQRAAIETIQALGNNFSTFIHDQYDRIMERVAELSKEALFDKGLNIIIFPEGSRSVKLTEGKTGLAQLALHTEKKIVPVACNYSDEVYTGSLPFARSGRIIYRVGEPLSMHDKLKEFRILEPFRLLSRESQRLYREQFEGVTKIVMESIEAMLDEKYKKSLGTT
jgi:1-acyl-sn-glycerol-3-phosphate acyltransferase